MQIKTFNYPITDSRINEWLGSENINIVQSYISETKVVFLYNINPDSKCNNCWRKQQGKRTVLECGLCMQLGVSHAKN